MDKERIENAVKEILFAIGENPERDGLKNTPKRIANMYEEIFSSIGKDCKDEINVFFNEDHDEMIIIKDIYFHSICEHHLVPFLGKVHIAYLPKKGKITGLSKLVRVVDSASKKPQIQERFTEEIADAIFVKLEALGVMVVVEAEHLCVTMRGIKKPGSKTVTSVVKGRFKSDEKTRAEAMSLIKN